VFGPLILFHTVQVDHGIGYIAGESAIYLFVSALAAVSFLCLFVCLFVWVCLFVSLFDAFQDSDVVELPQN
jgi:hypothetical protein